MEKTCTIAIGLGIGLELVLDDSIGMVNVFVLAISFWLIHFMEADVPVEQCFFSCWNIRNHWKSDEDWYKIGNWEKCGVCPILNVSAGSEKTPIQHEPFGGTNELCTRSVS